MRSKFKRLPYVAKLLFLFLLLSVLNSSVRSVGELHGGFPIHQSVEFRDFKNYIVFHILVLGNFFGKFLLQNELNG